MRARQQKPPETRRADILRASEKLFLANGINATRIEDIAKEADMGKGTLYLYFKSKDDILVGLGLAFIDYFVARIEYHQKRCKSNHIKTQIEAWLNGCLDTFYDKSDLHDLVFHHSNRRPVEHKHENPAVKALEDILSTHDRVDSAFCSAIIFNIVHGGMDYAFSQQPVMPREELFHRLVPLIKKLLLSD